MKTWANQYQVVFFVGFSALVVSLGYGILADAIFSTQPFPFALRWLGVGYMFGGLVLWAMAERYKAERPDINPLLGVMVAAGCITLVVGLFLLQNPFALGPVVWAGIAVNALAVLIALVMMVVNPAYETPPTRVWPEGGEPPAPEPHAHDEHDDHGHDDHPMAGDDVHVVSEIDEDVPIAPIVPAEVLERNPDDFTRIEGIGPRIEAIFHAAGLFTYADLAARSPSDLTVILQRSGFTAPFQATTWPEQAELAAQGKWDDLDALQDHLKGGRRR